MNYSKIGYYLAKENETKLNNLISDKYTGFNCDYFEDQRFDFKVNNNNKSFYLPTFISKGNKDIYLELSLELSNDANSLNKEITLDFILNDEVIATSNFTLCNKKNVVLFQKIPIITNEVNSIEIRFVSGVGFTLLQLRCLLMGYGVNFVDGNYNIKFNAVKNSSKVACYYISNNKLYHCIKDPSMVALEESEMIYVCNVKSACFSFSKQKDSDGEEKLFLFRVDSLGNLFIKNFREEDEEIFICQNISYVSACKLPDNFNEDMLVGIVQDGKAKYFTISFVNESMKISAFVEIAVKNENVKSVTVVNTLSNNAFIVVRTLKNNYIFVNGEEIFKNYCIDSLGATLLIESEELNINEESGI